MKKAFKRIVTMILVVVIAASAAISVFAENGAVNKHTYDIAVVFDNSTSMYGNDAWCQAKYSMEIFASMLDYSRDKLTIFPMWEVQTAVNPIEPDTNDTSSFNPQKAANSLEIKNISDIDKIHRMYTTYGGSTPFAAAEDAKKYLESSSATDKWLIVLTDGMFDEDTGVREEDKLAAKLKSFARNGTNVQYLGIGSDSNDLGSFSDASKGFYADRAMVASQLSSSLINICNKIFQRNILPADKLDDDKNVMFDISMNKVIVFVQGDGARIKELSDSSNKKVAKISDSGERKYSEITYSLGIGYLNKNKVTKDTVETNDELYGHVVIFDKCKAGKYKLDYDGNKQYVQIFYEPDVDIKYSLTEAGNEEIFIDDSMLASGAIDVSEGEYKLDYYLVDGVTGERIEESELLGKTDICGNIEYSDGRSLDISAGETVVLEPADGVKFKISGTYLDGQYKISTEDSKGIIQLSIKPKPIHELKTKVDCEQQQNWYYTKDSDNWQPVLITAELDGEPLTGDELAMAEIKLSSKSGIKYTTPQLTEDGTAYMVYVFRDDNGEVVIPKAGTLELFNGKTCDLKAELTYLPEDADEPLTDDSEVKVRVSNIPLGLHNTIALVILAGLLFIVGLILFILYTTRCFPKRVTIRDLNTDEEMPLILRENCDIPLSFGANLLIVARLHKKSNFFLRKSSRASFDISNIYPINGSVSSVTICGQDFVRTPTGFVDPNDDSINLSDYRQTISDSTGFSYTVDGSGMTSAVFEINR